MSPLSRRSRRRKVNKGSRRSPGPADKGSRRSPWPTGSSLEERIDEIMDRVQQAGDDHAERAAALEQLRPLRASFLAALGRAADEIQQHAAQGEHT
jgi:hypothetical protein